jgi:hypothetical protein
MYITGSIYPESNGRFHAILKSVIFSEVNLIKSKRNMQKILKQVQNDRNTGIDSG